LNEDRDFTFLLLAGAKDDPDYRYNVGIVNASDPLTTITIRIQPFQGDGEPFLDDNDFQVSRTVTLQPASHVQYNDIFNSLLGLGHTPDDTILKISFLQWSTGSSSPVVGMTVYGTMIDNRTQDPTSLLPAFGYPYDVECQWPPTEEKNTGGGSYPRVGRRPVEIPPR
jgi:hypothetical protein